MRPLSTEERWALTILAGPGQDFDALTPEGARMGAAMVQLIERGGCIGWQRCADDRGTAFWITELGRLALRVAAALDVAMSS